MNKKHWLFRAVSLVTVAIVAFAAVGCSLQEKDESDTVIAQVDETKITYGEFNELYQMYVSAYQSYGYDIESDPTTASYLKTSIINDLVQEQVLAYQAKKQGFTKLTEEQQAVLDERIATTKSDIDAFYRSTAEEEAAEDSSIDVETRIEELIKEEADYYYPELNLTASEYLEKMVEDTTKAYYVELLQNSVYEPLSVSDEEVQTWYDENVAALKEEYAEDSSLYATDMDEYRLNDGQPVVYQPSGYSNIMHILVAPEGELPEEYDTNKADMEVMLTEAGELALGVTESADSLVRIGELQAEYAKLKEANDKMEADYYADAKAQIEAAFAKLEAGEDFAAVMAEYTQDKNFIGEDSYAETGMLIYEGAEAWSDSIVEQFKLLQPGQYSAVFQDDEGLHIIYYVGDVQEGPVALETVKEDIREFLLSDKQSTEWNASVKAWMDDSSVTIYEQRLADLGITLSTSDDSTSTDDGTTDSAS